MVGGRVPATDDSVMPIAWKERGGDSVDTNVGHEELVKGAEKPGNWFPRGNNNNTKELEQAVLDLWKYVLRFSNIQMLGC